MFFRYLRYFYFNLLICFLLFFNMPLLILFLFVIKFCYSSWKVSFDSLNIGLIKLDVDDEVHIHIDYDTDSNYYFRLMKSEYYLWFNCYFFFSYHGGENLLNQLDFIDLVFYKLFDYRNFKYSYKDIYYKIIYNNADYYFLYEFNKIYKKKYNLKYNLQLLNKDTFNILNNMDNKKKLDNIKKYIYKKNIWII